MQKDTSDLIIVRATHPGNSSAPVTHLDAFWDDWLYDADARRQKIPGWDWEDFNWKKNIPAWNFETMAAVDQADRLEGLISIDPDPTVAPGMLVAEYVQVAPWNYEFPGSPAERRGIGTMLLRWAVKRSEELGRNGALTFSSTKKSEGYYPKLGFRCVGTRNGQKVWELPASEVANFRKIATLKGVGAP